MMSSLNMEKFKKALNKLNTDIYLLTKGKWRAVGYVRRAFCFLREHLELCKQPDWKRLYEECIYFQIVDARVNHDWTDDEPAEQRKWIELLADLENKHKNGSSSRFDIKEVEKFLEYRKAEWNLLKAPLVIK